MQHNRAQPRFAHDAAVIVTETGERAGWIGCGKSSEPVVNTSSGTPSGQAAGAAAMPGKPSLRSSPSASMGWQSPRSGESATRSTTVRLP